MFLTTILSPSVSWLVSQAIIIFVAGIGGVLVFWGIWMEGSPDEKEFRDVKEMREHKTKAKRGWNLLMVGIFIEIVVAVVFAAREGWEARKTANEIENNAPFNQPISELSAIVRIRVKGRNNVELPTGNSRVAMLWLSDKFVPVPSILSGNLHPYPRCLPDFVSLEADRFELIKSEQFLLPASKPDSDFHEYMMRFRSDLFSEGILWDHQPLRENRPKAKELDNAKIIWCSLKFLPHDSEILEGTVVVIANSNVRKVFVIADQKNFQMDPDRPVSEWSDFGFISTNGLALEKK